MGRGMPQWPVVMGVVAMVLAPASMLQAATSAEFVVALPAISQRFDPVEMVALTDVMNYNLLYDGLFNLGSEGKQPGLAVESKVAANGLTIDFILRRGVKFHGGDPFTADDVKFTFERLLSPSSTHAYRRGFQESLERVEVLDPYRVRFHLKRPWASFFTTSRYALQAIVPKRYYEHVGAKGFQQKPVGTGPFRFAAIQPGEWTRFEANPSYWGGAPEIKVIVQRLVAEPLTRLAMLTRGEADLIGGLTGSLLKELRRNPSLREVSARYAGTSFLTFNRRTNPEFNDRRVRRAIAHAIDREGITESVLGGVCQVAGEHFTPATFGFDQTIKPIPYDPAHAKALLKEAGIKDGHEIRFVIHTQAFPSLPDAPEALEAIAGQLEAVGLKIIREPRETGALLAGWRNHTLPGISYGPSSVPDDGGVLMDSWFVSWGTFSNEIKDPAYDETFQRQLAEPNQDRRLAILKQWARTEADRVEAVPLFWCNAPFAVGPRVKTWKPGFGSGYHLNLQQLTLTK